MQSILNTKFSNIDENDVEIYSSKKLYCLSIFDKFNRMEYYQHYELLYGYCGEVMFRPLKNEFVDGKLFTNDELKTIFNVECDNINTYCLDRLYNDFTPICMD